MKSVNWLAIAGFTIVLSVQAISQPKPGVETAGFAAFLSSLDAAQLELQNGRAEAFKNLWSKDGDVTLSGGFGGTVEKGWDAVSNRLDWVGANFSKGTNKIERLVRIMTKV